MLEFVCMALVHKIQFCILPQKDLAVMAVQITMLKLLEIHRIAPNKFTQE